MPFEALHERLLKGGIAPRHVRRYLGELEDHLVELIRCEEDAGYAPAEAAARASATLGDDTLLAEAMLSQPKLRSLTARAPWLVFGILPPFLVVAAFVVPVLCVIGLARAGGLTGRGIDAPLWYQHMVLALAFVSTLLLPGLVSVLLVWLAQCQRSALIWPLIAAALLVALNVQWHAGFAPAGHHSGYLSVSFWFFEPRQMRLDWPMVVAQAVLIVSPVGWAWRKRSAA